MDTNINGLSYANQAMQMVKSIGSQAMAALMPNDFEWYLISFELADADNNTIDYLTFPIQPDSIMKIEQNRNTIKKSMYGVTVLSSTALSLGELVLRGSFGRNFKIMVNSEEVSGSGFSISNGKHSLFDLVSGSSGNKFFQKGLSFNFGSFGTAVKTGYGVLKILQAMIDKSCGVGPDGRPFKLFFYNMALGESYQVVVPPNGVKYTQDVTKNMIWYYDLRFTIVAPLEAVSIGKGNAWRNLAASAIQGGVDITASAVKDLITPTLEDVTEVTTASFKKAVDDDMDTDYSDF